MHEIIPSDEFAVTVDVAEGETVKRYTGEPHGLHFHRHPPGTGWVLSFFVPELGETVVIPLAQVRSWRAAT